MVDYLRVVLSNTWINLTYTTGHFVLKPLAVNVRYAEILALPLNVPFWPMLLKNGLESARLAAMLESKAFEREGRR